MERQNRLQIVRYLRSLEDSFDFASKLAHELKLGDLLLLTGGIGSGKTTFVQAVAEGLGVSERVTSPSFVLQAFYGSGRIPLNHVDLYRLNTKEEIESVGFEDFFDSSVTAVEWADRYACFRPPNLILSFEFGLLERDRVLTVTPQGGDWLERLLHVFPEVDT